MSFMTASNENCIQKVYIVSFMEMKVKVIIVSFIGNVFYYHIRIMHVIVLIVTAAHLNLCLEIDNMLDILLDLHYSLN